MLEKNLLAVSYPYVTQHAARRMQQNTPHNTPHATSHSTPHHTQHAASSYTSTPNTPLAGKIKVSWHAYERSRA
jgi:hypothetical protein